MRDLVPFVRFKQREKHTGRSDTSSKVAIFSLQLDHAWHQIFTIL